MNTQICKQCKLSKIKINRDTTKEGSDRWQDEHGKRWNGNTCPDCFREAKRKAIQNSRLKNPRPS